MWQQMWVASADIGMERGKEGSDFHGKERRKAIDLMKKELGFSLNLYCNFVSHPLFYVLHIHTLLSPSTAEK